MKPRHSIGRATSPDGTKLELIEHDGDYLLNADGMVLMSTRLRHSEEVLAKLGCQGLGPGSRVLIGGLGMGFTLRASLDYLPDDATVVQAELVPEVVEWNRGPLGEKAGRPLDDPRSEIRMGDVAKIIRSSRQEFDAILLDVDNGPSPLVTEKNAVLYSDAGLRASKRALKPGGRLAIWSADNNRYFPEKMRRIGFDPIVHKVRGHVGGGPPHIVFVGT